MVPDTQQTCRIRAYCRHFVRILLHAGVIRIPGRQLTQFLLIVRITDEIKHLAHVRTEHTRILQTTDFHQTQTVVRHQAFRPFRQAREIQDAVQATGAVPLPSGIQHDGDHRIQAALPPEPVQVFPGRQPFRGLPCLTPDSGRALPVCPRIIAHDTQRHGVVRFRLRLYAGYQAAPSGYHQADRVNGIPSFPQSFPYFLIFNISRKVKFYRLQWHFRFSARIYLNFFTEVSDQAFPHQSL